MSGTLSTDYDAWEDHARGGMARPIRRASGGVRTRHQARRSGAVTDA